MKEGTNNPQPDPLSQAVEKGARLLRKGARNLRAEALDRFLKSDPGVVLVMKMWRSEPEEVRTRYVYAVVKTLLEGADGPITQGYIRERLQPALMRFCGLNPENPPQPPGANPSPSDVQK